MKPIYDFLLGVFAGVGIYHVASAILELIRGQSTALLPVTVGAALVGLSAYAVASLVEMLQAADTGNKIRSN